jgi:hypothetical protein
VDNSRAIQSPLLTEAEAAAWLRLTEPGGPRCPAGTIKFYRSRGLLRGVRVGRRMLYPRKELERFIDRLLERGERESRLLQEAKRE